MKQSPMASIRHFLKETGGELGRCTWPAKNALIESTILVIFVTVVLAGFVALVDFVFRYFMQLITL